MTSALCSTNGRISSPAPKRSPTSFIAGSSTWLSTVTGSWRFTASSTSASIPAGLRCRIWKWIFFSTGSVASSASS